MRLVFRDLLYDPSVPRRRVFRCFMADLVHALGSGLLLGTTIGCGMLLIWYITRSDQPIDLNPMFSVASIIVLLLAAGFIGARLSGSVIGGVWPGFVAGLIAALSIPGDAWIFGMWGFFDLPSLLFTMMSEAASVMLVVTAGAVFANLSSLRANLPSLQQRIRRSARAFLDAWGDPELTA